MAIITLTTDYGLRDYYVAAAKGVLNSRFQSVNIVDVSHQIDMYDIGMGSYVLKNASTYFPDGTIHIFAVDASITTRQNYLVMRYNQQFFIAPDNGALSLILANDKPGQLLSVEPDASQELFAFLADVIAAIFNGDLGKMGQEIDRSQMVQTTELTPHITAEGNVIKGHIVYEDHYGNAITNVSKKMFEEIGQGRDFELTVSKYKLTRINKFYDDFNLTDRSLKDYEGQLFLIFNQNDNLQMSIYKGVPNKGGSVNSLIGMGYRDSFVITFKE